MATLTRRDRALIFHMYIPCDKTFPCEPKFLGQSSRSRSQGQKLWYHKKGLVTRNAHVQYENPISSGKKVMAKVKVFQGQGHEVKNYITM